MDPLSITVGALGITQAAIASFTALRGLINGLSEAQGNFRDIASNLGALEQSLNALSELKFANVAEYDSALNDLKKTGVVEAVNSCEEACAEFRRKLGKWTKHSASDKLSRAALVSVGVWKKERIRTLQLRVQCCKSTVSFAVQCMQLRVQVRSEHRSSTAHCDVMQQFDALRGVIQEHIEFTKRELAETCKRRLELERESQGDGEEGESWTPTSNEVDRQSRLLETDRRNCETVLSQTWPKSTSQDFGDIRVAENSKAAIGLPANVVGTMGRQRIHGVIVQGKSAAVVGVFSDDFTMTTL